MLSIIRKWSHGVSQTPSPLQNLYTAVCIIQRQIVYSLHPEVVKQSVKQRDADILCKFLQSDEYKKKVSEFIDLQNKILKKISPSAEVKYEHVLCCAQPKVKKAKAIRSIENKKPKKKKVKGTVLKMLMDKKEEPYPAYQPKNIVPVIMKKKEQLQDGQRLTTTIVPLYLMKIQQHKDEVIRKERSRKIDQLNHQSFHKFNEFFARQEQIARERVEIEEEEDELLEQRKTYKTYGYKDEMKDEDAYAEEDNKKRRMSSVNARGGMTAGVPSRGLRTFFNDLHQKKTKKSSQPAKQAHSKIPVKIGNLEENQEKREKRPYSVYVEECDAPKASKKQMEKNTKKSKKKLSEIEVNIDNLEGKNTIVAIKNRKVVTTKPHKPFVSLFHRVKSVTSRPRENPADAEKNAHPQNQPQKAEVTKKDRNPTKSSDSTFTYKLVSNAKSRTEASVRNRIKMHSTFWNNSFNFSSRVKKAKQKQEKRRRLELEKEKEAKKSEDSGSIDTVEFQKAEEHHQKMGTILRKFRTFRNSGDKPTEPKKSLAVDSPAVIAIKSNERTILVTSLFWRLCETLKKPIIQDDSYLMRLPKTTIEGYRVLMYGVKDPDPTKMNFSDCVKGFCMYNDCVLSEDGLQDGYIVIFDMKDVSIGHLARVSLPALKCFMYYIQEAHPCRLKAIHVLNTASWIQHVMRLVVPLVRSELLNLVKFHKGNTPEDFPTELLPLDYGGEAPSVEELDQATKSMVGKYRDWLIESSQFKADESQRVKKAGWWGLFSSNKNQNVELDEKTILKNLQID